MNFIKNNNSALNDDDTINSNTISSKVDNKESSITYDADKMIGHGSFGTVFRATIASTNEVVAIKKVFQDKRFKNRELQIMRMLAKQPHPNIIILRHYFVSNGSKPGEIYINLVLDFFPETMFSLLKSYYISKTLMPLELVKTYMFQLSRALAHIHGMGICHRDIKPQNLLVDPITKTLKLCDFGSAKILTQGELNVAYICSRYYRAPELIFGSTNYTTSIDIWSFGCIIAELLLGAPLFPGTSGADQLVEIIKILGTPTKDDLMKLNQNYKEFNFPLIRTKLWSNIFKSNLNIEFTSLLDNILVYIPENRLNAIAICGLEIFNEFTNIKDIEFTNEELNLCLSQELKDKLTISIEKI